MVIEEESQTITVTIVLNKTNVPFEPELVFIPDEPVLTNL